MPHDQAYLEAEKKIEEARRSGATELDLSAKYDAKDIEKLTELPESLGQLTQLLSLNLSRNQLTTLPEPLGQLTQLQTLDLSANQLTVLPNSLGQLAQLQELNLANNLLTVIPESLGQLTQLQTLNLSDNKLTTLPESLGQLRQLQVLDLDSSQIDTLPPEIAELSDLETLFLGNNKLTMLPPEIGQLKKLKRLYLHENKISTLPLELSQCKYIEDLTLSNNSFVNFPSLVIQFSNLRRFQLGESGIVEIPPEISQLKKLQELWLRDNGIVNLPSSLGLLEYLVELNLDINPLNPELAEAYEQGTEVVKLYLRAGPVVTIHEAKLILVGEGEVGKTCLMDALLDKEWQEHPSTHGIEIQQIKVTDSETKKETTLNGWDFGGQRVYRPTHQLFFSAPAVYLVVWKPREGPQQGFVKEWIQLVKRREPSAKIIVVATHGGPQQRQPDIDRQELWDLFGKETVVDFFFVDSKPDDAQAGNRKGIEELKLAIARIAAELPEVGRSVPKSFADVRAALQAKGVPYLPLDDVLAICRLHNMDDEIARLFITISHRLGHLTHYENDPALRDIVILRPDWLATAMSYVLDDEETRKDHGLVKLSRLSQLWNDPSRPNETRYPEKLHKIFYD